MLNVRKFLFLLPFPNEVIKFPKKFGHENPAKGIRCEFDDEIVRIDPICYLGKKYVNILCIQKYIYCTRYIYERNVFYMAKYIADFRKGLSLITVYE